MTPKSIDRPATRGLTAMALTTVLLLAGCGGGSTTPNAAPTEKTLELSFLQDPGQPPDPDVFYGTQGLLLTTNLYEGLLTFASGTATPTLAPALATTWTESPDHRTFTFQLRQGVKFHDGTPLTSAAIKASFDRRAAVDQGPAYMVKEVESVETQGDFAATIQLKSPDSSFLYALASPYGPKLTSPTALAANAGNDHGQTYLTTHDVGTGPYQLTDAKIGDKYQLSAFADYWGKKPYYETVNVPVMTDSSAQQLALESGTIAAILHDIPSSAVNTYTSNPKFATHILPTAGADYMYVNPHTPVMTDPAVRKALLQAVNVDELVTNAYFSRGTAAKQIYPANINDPRYAPQKIAYDPEVLKAAVNGLPANTRAIVIGYDSSSPDNQQVAALMGNQLSQSGLTVTEQAYPASQIFGWTSNRDGAPDILVNLGFPDAPHPYLFEHINFDPDGGVNFFGCSSPEATALIARGRETGSAEDFSTAAEQAQATGCWMNLVDVADFMVTQPWLKGVEQAHNVAVPTSLSLNELYQ
ncbi:ABC transporter substrate-binding protein [Mycobacterium sp. AT1]|uniref:ABC transporter substrate-binding protein n=1 Tax=Mycobacterium sp. AT1 TaxID=1961706 RepID=UPI0009AC2AB2|nr:ABC transporter substrate-binding protein [Mycobacterium sp. AT1]OPX11355.1 ABC transporter substrate-binding protein [Mycobacterium sp. AT1]